MPSGHWLADTAHTEEYLDVALNCARTYAPLRDKYCPGGEMWVTESGDAGGGGDTWASTYLDVLRTLNELAGFAAITDGVIFHNTLASSDYGFLAREVFDPRPNYFAVLLWNRLMGTTVYDTAEPLREGAHVFAHSRKDGKEGVVYLVINNSLTETTTVELPKSAERYTLAGEGGNVRAAVMTLNGKPLVLGAGNSLPELTPAAQEAGTVTLCTGNLYILRTVSSAGKQSAPMSKPHKLARYNNTIRYSGAPGWVATGIALIVLLVGLAGWYRAFARSFLVNHCLLMLCIRSKRVYGAFSLCRPVFVQSSIFLTYMAAFWLPPGLATPFSSPRPETNLFSGLTGWFFIPRPEQPFFLPRA